MDRDLSSTTAPDGKITISVCTVCKAPDGGASTGPALLEALRETISDAAQVRAVQCLGVCKRPTTVAVTCPDGYTFLFGDLQTDTGSAALTAFVKSYSVANYGLVPWRERTDVLRKGMVARIPPVRWSPDDGHAPT